MEASPWLVMWLVLTTNVLLILDLMIRISQEMWKMIRDCKTKPEVKVILATAEKMLPEPTPHVCSHQNTCT